MESNAESKADEIQAVQKLAEEIFRERVERAQQMKPDEKLSAGAKLFEYAASITLAGIRAQNPGILEADARKILQERLALKERLENSKWNSIQPSSR